MTQRARNDQRMNVKELEANRDGGVQRRALKQHVKNINVLQHLHGNITEKIVNVGRKPWDTIIKQGCGSSGSVTTMITFNSHVWWCILISSSGSQRFLDQGPLENLESIRGPPIMFIRMINQSIVFHLGLMALMYYILSSYLLVSLFFILMLSS